MVDLLLARGAPIDARNLAGSTALYMAAEGSHILIAQRLIERGADVKLTGRSGISPIAAAAYAGNDIIFEALLARGADERAPDDTGKPPIVYAAAGARFDIVKRLLARNIDVNARYPNDLTLLMWALGPGRRRSGSPGGDGCFVSAGRWRPHRRSGRSRPHRADDRGRRRPRRRSPARCSRAAPIPRSRTRPESAPRISPCCLRCASG